MAVGTGINSDAENKVSIYERVFVEDLPRFLDFARVNLCGWVYRGQSKSEWLLESTLERKIPDRIDQSDVFDLGDIASEIFKLEHRVLQEFKNLWCKFGKKNLKEPQSWLEWAMLAQHYGCPTRLIDFTDDIDVALCFASSENQDHDFSIWALKNAAFSVGNAEKDYELCRDILESKTEDVPNDKWVVLRPRSVAALHAENVVDRLELQNGLFVMPLRFDISVHYLLSNGMNLRERIDRTNRPCTTLSNFNLEQNVDIVEFVVSKEERKKGKSYLKDAGRTPVSLFLDSTGIGKQIDFLWPFGYDCAKWGTFPLNWRD